MVTKTVKEELSKERNEVASMDKKRKNESDEELDLCAFDSTDKALGLNEFNYKDMDDLRIESESDGEVSV
jgi:hypothetical protein